MNTMLVVTDMDKTVEFYKRVLGLDVIMDFGANKTLTGGLALQTLETYKEFNWIQVRFLSVAIILKFILKKIVLINLRITSESVMFNMFTRLRNIRGDSVWFAFMTRTDILSKWAKI